MWPVFCQHIANKTWDTVMHYVTSVQRRPHSIDIEKAPYALYEAFWGGR
jgi:hypothetical protein